MFSYRLTQLRDLLTRHQMTFICNAIAADITSKGYSHELYSITDCVWQQMRRNFPEEFVNTENRRLSSTLNSWVSDKNKMDFFGYVQDSMSDMLSPPHIDVSIKRQQRQNFLGYLIEKYGDVQISIE